MNPFKRKLQAAMLLAALATPVAALAEDAPAAPAAASQQSAAPAQADRAELMQTMRTRMHEILQTQDPAKRQELMDAQMKDRDTLMQTAQGGPGMGGMMGGPGGKADCKMGKGPGMGMMMGPGGKKPCHTGHPDNCDRRHDAASDQRLDALEKRMDMMQMMMRMMMRDD